MKGCTDSRLPFKLGRLFFGRAKVEVVDAPIVKQQVVVVGIKGFPTLVGINIHSLAGSPDNVEKGPLVRMLM